MCKLARLLFALLIVSVLMVMPGLAQDTSTEEVDVVADILLPRLEEYGAALPEKYGTLSVETFLEMLAETEDIVILDVREVKEIEETGIIEGAINVPLRTLGENINLLPDLDATIVVVCKGGFRATIGMTTLHVLGYMNTKVLIGGFDAWVGEELPVVEAAAEVEAAEIPEDIDPLLIEHVAAYLANLPEGWGAVKPADFFEETFDALPDLLLDVRSDEEWADPGYIEGATHIWIDEFVANLDQLPKEFDSSIVVYCATSYRAGIVATMLGLIGYEDVRNISGGLKGWIAADLPVIKD